MYCADNIISCSIIYSLNVLGLALLIVMLVCYRKHYLWAFAVSFRQDDSLLDYTIDYTHRKNIHVFLKFVAVIIGFIALGTVCFIQICLWDPDFGFMDLSDMLLWLGCASTFYLDYKPLFRITKQLRTLLAVLLFIQICTMLIFVIERNLEESDEVEFLNINVYAYLANFLILSFINICSLFFPNFHYNKDYKGIQEYSIQEDIRFQNTQKVVVVKRPSFLDQLQFNDQYPESKIVHVQEHSLQQALMHNPDSSYDYITPTPHEHHEEKSFIEKQKEQEDLMDEIKSIHKQLDAKIDQFTHHTPPKQQDIPDQENHNADHNEDEQVDQWHSKKQKNRSFLANSHSQTPSQSNKPEIKQSNGDSLAQPVESLQSQSQPQPQQQTQLVEPIQPQIIPIIPKYDIKTIKIDGFEEVKKQGKRTIVYLIYYYSHKLQREVKTERSIKEIQSVCQILQGLYPKYKIPQLPERKPNERQSSKEVTQKGQLAETALQYIIKEEMMSPEFQEFLKETGPANSSKKASFLNDQPDKYNNDIDEMLKQTDFDLLMQNRGSVSIKKALINFNENEDDSQFIFPSLNSSALAYNSVSQPKSEQALQEPQQQQTQTQQTQQIVQQQEVIVDSSKAGFVFYIRELKLQGSTTFYKIEAEYDGKQTASVLKRYNEFKSIHKKLIEKQINIPALPDKSTVTGLSDVQYRKQALTDYINQVYSIGEAKVNASFKEFLGI